MLGDCVDEKLTLVVKRRYWYCKLLKISDFGCTKYPFGVFLQKNGKLDEL